MKHSRKIELSGKGWSEEEIHHAEKTLERADLQDVHFSKIVFWSALIVIIFANIIISLIFIPFLVAFKSTILFAVIILMGGLIGFLYNFLIVDERNDFHFRLAFRATCFLYTNGKHLGKSGDRLSISF